MRYCLKCGAQLPDDKQINMCPYCNNTIKTNKESNITYNTRRMKYCARCGAEIKNSENITECSECGNTIGKNQNGKNIYRNYNNNVQKNHINYKPQKKMNFSFVKKVLLVISVICVILWGKSRLINKPNENYFMDNVPDEILNYLLNGECRSLVDSIEIERRITQKGTDDTFCKVILKDDNLLRIMYIEFVSTKYDKGWYLDSWQEYKESEITPLKAYSESELLEILNNRGYSSYTNWVDESDLENGHLLYYIDVDETSEYIDSYGTIVVEGEFIIGVSENSSGYPCEYRWEDSWDYSGITTKWHINGQYYCDVYEDANTNIYDLSVSVATEDDMLYWDYTYDSYELLGYPIMDYGYVPREGSYSSSFDKVEGGKVTNMSNPYLKIRLNPDALSGYVTIGFTRDEAFLFPGDNAVELVKDE